MLQTRHFSNRLLANKLGRTFSSNWRSSSTKIFGAQFSGIQSFKNGCPYRCIILPKINELCQRHQFCSTMADGGSIPPFPLPFDQQSANSSPSSIPSPEMAADGDREQKAFKLLEYRRLHLNRLGNKTLKLILTENRENGRKLFRINFYNKDKSANFPGIPMPEDGYTFLWGMDNLMGELASGNIDPQEFKDPPQQLTIAADDSAESKRMEELSVVEFIGQTRNFQLGLVLFPDAEKENRKGEICFVMRASPPLKNENGNSKWVTLSLRALPWLRAKMAEMLIKYDGKQAIGEAAQIPKKFFIGKINPRQPNVLDASK